MPDPCLNPSPRISLSVSGTPGALQADIIPSVAPGNGVELLTDGLWVPGPATYVTGALPVVANDGDEIIFMADPTNGVAWHLRYNGTSASPYKWEFIGGSAMYLMVLTAENRAAGGSAYAALPTPVDIQLPPVAGDFEIEHGAHIGAGTDGQGANQTVKLGVTAAGNNESCVNGNTRTAACATIVRGLGLPASSILSLRYSNADAANPANFAHRYMNVRPIRVG